VVPPCPGGGRGAPGLAPAFTAALGVVWLVFHRAERRRAEAAGARPAGSLADGGRPSGGDRPASGHVLRRP